MTALIWIGLCLGLIYLWSQRKSFPSRKGRPSDLHRALLRRVGGDKQILERLVKQAQIKHPGRSRQWLYEKVIFDLERDRDRR